ncbi:serine/threonine protein kinase [Paenibacillus sp. NPDC058071]|uniref:serine/threonine protein kinase n=1 Tax=Paenibacillus sp. NPDC058071 TaxID=3346326 RepID=UPI0036DE9F7E
MLKRWTEKWRRMRESWLDYPLQEGSLRAGGRYRIERFAGMGSYGVAYKAVELATGRTVLMKWNKPSKGDLGLTLLRREHAVMRKLDHPQIPKALAYVEEGKNEAIVMEFIEGRSLEEEVMGVGRVLTEREALLALLSVMRPLGYLHEAGCVHLDVRLPNVLVLGGDLYLIDFGLARATGEQLPEALLAALGENSGDIGGVDEEVQGRISWRKARMDMRRPEPSSDLQAAGHLFLYLMYSGYEDKEGQEERGWEEELELRPEVRNLIRRMLGSESAEGSAAPLTALRCAKELEALLSE